MTAIFCLSGRELSLATFRNPELTIAKLDCSAHVREVLGRAVAWEPEARFADAGAMVANLRAAHELSDTKRADRASNLALESGLKKSEALFELVQLSRGDVIDQYRVHEFLGEGSMGTVFEVEHVALGRRYALKVLRAKVIERDPGAAQKFLREARTAARVRHRNIVDVLDLGHLSDGRPYFVMELLEGQSLADLIARGALAPGEVVLIARQLADALAAAHDRGVVHADITPSNVLVVDPGEQARPGELTVKLVDFGLAELTGDGLRDANPEFVLGTPAYISPEQLRGLAPTDRSDQYGLGAVLFELLTGHPPYQHDDLRTLCMMHLTGPIPTVESPLGPLPPKLADVVTTCLQKAPRARFPGMRALLVALDEIERVTGRGG